MINALLSPLIRRRADHAGVTCLSDASCTLQRSPVRCCIKTTFSVLAPNFARFKSWRPMPQHPPQAWRKVHARPRSHHPPEVSSQPHWPQSIDHLPQDPRGIVSRASLNLHQWRRLVRVGDQSLDRRSPWLAAGYRSDSGLYDRLADPEGKFLAFHSMGSTGSLTKNQGGDAPRSDPERQSDGSAIMPSRKNGLSIS